MLDAHADRVRPNPSRLRPIIAALVTLAIFLTATALAWTSIIDVARQDASAEFEANADLARVSVEGQIQLYYDRLRDVGTFISTTGDASPDELTTYVRGSRIFDQLPRVVGVLYINRVAEADLDQFVEEMRRSNPDFAVFDISTRTGPIRYLLTYYAPGRVDLGLPIGTDVSAISAVTQLLTNSASTGRGIAGSFQDDPLLQQIASRTDFPMIRALLDLDFFIGIPIYAPGTEVLGPPNVPIGWVAATIDDFDDVADSASLSVSDELGMELTVDLAGTGMTDRTDLSRVAQVESPGGARSDAAFETSRSIETEGIEWRLDVWSAPDADALPASARITLAAGIAGSALAAGLVYVRLRERDRERAYAGEMEERERFQREILDSVTNAMVVIDAAGTIVRANPAWHDLWADARFERPSDDISGWVGVAYLDAVRRVATTGRDDLVDAVTGVLDHSLDTTDLDLAIAAPDVGLATATASTAAAVTTSGGSERHDTSARPPPGEPGSIERWLSVRVTPLRGQRPGAIVIHTDITDRKRSHDELEAQAARDTLTGLANRTTFEERVESALAPAREGNHRIAVLFIDLDGFKPVNDTYGHAVGDDVLRTVARRIDSVVRSSDTAARLGGDEFVVLIDPLPDRSVAEATAERILSALSTPIGTDNIAISLAASIGVAVIEGPTTESAASLIERADAAMYISKQQGGARTTITGD